MERKVARRGYQARTHIPRLRDERLFTRCLVCGTPFPPNEALEHFPHAKRVAFDPVRGRLWAVCRTCNRWSLSPIEERWEALEELEKLVTDRARLLSKTDNIALMRVDGLDVVRVGSANLTEEAWWRYGREFTKRREAYKKVTFAGSVAAGAIIWGGWATGGLGWLGAWLLWENAPDSVASMARWLRFGSTAWSGEQRCSNCGFLIQNLEFRERSKTILEPVREGPGVLGIARRCPVCHEIKGGGLHLTGPEGEHAVRRMLAHQHHRGAGEKQVKSATRLIHEAGSPEDLTRIVVRDGRALSDVQRTGAIALEIAANESVERRLLEMELGELEAHWRQEEELAGIIDGELTPLPMMESLRRRVSGAL